jgi:large subunit ribosomal protein L9
VGLRGEVVNVARGYARNYLLPRGLAEVATPGLLRELERRDALRARHEAKSTEEAQAIATRLEATELRFDVNAGPTGALFGSVTATNVADRLWDEQKIRIDRRKLGIDTIKRVGRYTVPVEVFADVTAELRLIVAPEGGELPPDEPEAVEPVEEAAAATGEEPTAAVVAAGASAPAEASLQTVSAKAEAEAADADADADAPVIATDDEAEAAADEQR